MSTSEVGGKPDRFVRFDEGRWTLGQGLVEGDGGFWSMIHDILDAEVVVLVAESLVTGMFGLDIFCQSVGDKLGKCRGVWDGWPGAKASGTLGINLSVFWRSGVSVTT